MKEIIYDPQKPIILSGEKTKIVNLTLPFVVLTNTTENDVFFSKDEANLGNVDAECSKMIKPGMSDFIPASWGVTNHFFADGAGKVNTEAFSSELAASQRVIINNQKIVMEKTNNPNLLINPDFAINQRHASGVITAPGYFVDRWKLVSGTVEVTKDGLILDGTIEQVLERSAGAEVTASASAGTPSYDNATHTFTLTASGESVTWAKLELGGIATPFTPPDPATELLKCQRYYYNSNAQIVFSAKSTMVPFQNYYTLPVTMRANPVIKIYDAEGAEGYASLRNDNSVKVAISTACANGRDFNLWATNGGMVANSEYRISYSADAEL